MIKQTNKYYMRNEVKYSRVSNVINEFLETTEKYKNIPESIMINAIETGNIIHQAIEWNLEGNNELAEGIVEGNNQYASLFKSFLAAKKELKIDTFENKNLDIERTIFSNTWKIAGTPDLIMDLENDYYKIVDWKTKSFNSNREFTLKEILPNILQILMYTKIIWNFTTERHVTQNLQNAWIVYLNKKEDNFRIIDVEKFLEKNGIKLMDMEEVVTTILQSNGYKMNARNFIKQLTKKDK